MTDALLQARAAPLHHRAAATPPCLSTPEAAHIVARKKRQNSISVLELKAFVFSISKRPVTAVCTPHTPPHARHARHDSSKRRPAFCRLIPCQLSDFPTRRVVCQLTQSWLACSAVLAPMAWNQKGSQSSNTCAASLKHSAGLLKTLTGTTAQSGSPSEYLFVRTSCPPSTAAP